jgi:hypothetical protein
MTETETTTGSLAEEIKRNVRRDRERLEKLQDKILSSLDQPVSDGEEGVPAHVMAAMADGVSRIADALTRSNSQLVEMAKMESRKAEPVGKDGFTDEERGAIFAKIEGSEEEVSDA